MITGTQMFQLRSSETERTSARDKLGIHLVADSLAIAVSEGYLLLKGRGSANLGDTTHILGARTFRGHAYNVCDSV